jgi:hypothetical protein
MQDYRKLKQAMETRREKRRGKGRPRKILEDCVIDAARRKGETCRTEETELLVGNGPRTQRCKAIEIDKEEEE